LVLKNPEDRSSDNDLGNSAEDSFESIQSTGKSKEELIDNKEKVKNILG
jgi:hypothetical protein